MPGSSPRMTAGGVGEETRMILGVSDWRRYIERPWIGVALALAAILAAPPEGRAQDYPSRAVKIIVPFPAGGTADVMPRIFSDWLSKKWGHPVVIENRTGAAGNIGAEAVAKADPDGYTLLAAGVKFQQVPYRGSAPALTDLAAGNVDLMFDNLGVSLALVKGGQLKLLGVATPNRMAALPQVPTIAQTLPGFESAAWFAIVAPPKTPAAVADKINADVNEALREAEIRECLAQLSAEPIGGTPLATAAYMREEVERWHKGIKAANVKLE